MKEIPMVQINEFLKLRPPSQCNWSGKVTFSLGHSHAGWIQLAITCTPNVQGLIIHTSAVFDPYPELVQWLNAIAAGNLPAECNINEEGYGKTLRASPVSAEEILFEIGEWPWMQNVPEEQPLYMYVQVAKKQFLAEFLAEWDEFLASKYDPAEWDDNSTNLSTLDVSGVRQFVEGGHE